MNVVIEVLYTLVYIVYTYFEAAFRLVVPRQAKSIRGDVVLVTGGAKGIGRHTAQLLAAKGATIVLWDIDQKSLKETAEDLKSTGAQVYTYQCNVRSYDDVRKNAAQMRRDVGDVDILINNAGLGICKSLLELSEEEIQRTMGVNTMAHFWTLKEFLPAMMTRNKGHVVTICSYAGLAGSPLMTDYTASKFAVRGLTDALEAELRYQKVKGINLTTVYPLFTNTALVDNVASHAKVHIRFGEILEPEAVAAAIVNGILRNIRDVYIPSHGCMVNFIVGAFPWKARQALADLLSMQFVNVNRK